MPFFVDIYRWNSDHFEKVSVTEATGNLYAQLDLVNDEWIIVTGGANSEPTLYKYENGKLIKKR